MRPEEINNNLFVYRFDVVDVRDVNAFTFPVGPRDMIAATANERELAGALTYETAHSTLRHGRTGK